MAGTDHSTGRLLDGWPHVVQSVMIVMTTFFGERMLRRWFGSNVPKLLGRNMTVETVTVFFSMLIAALEVKELSTGLPREPRFKITKIVPHSVDRLGTIKMTVTGVYMPRGHLGDTTVEDTRSIALMHNVVDNTSELLEAA